MDSIQNHLKKYVYSDKFKQRYNDLIQDIQKDAEIQAFILENKEILSEDILQNSYAKLYEFMKEKQRIKESGYSQNPGFEPKLVMNVGFIDVAYQPTADFLAQEERRELSNRIQTLQMPRNIKNITFASLDKTKARADVLKYFIDFCNEYTQTKNNFIKGAYLYGSYGVGKTYMIGGLANELASRGVSSYLAHFPSLVVELKAAIGDNSVQQKLDVIKKSTILMLDDIGGESMTPWVRDDILMTILDYRMREQLPTFFTSNLSFALLEEHLKGVTIEDERKAKRLMERIKYLSKEINIVGKNRREM
ncbi:primosomal protein DnaI [Granulicatella sp. zg-ZJ]|uniref:primosomal protein DnaI n=1 Tax=unclassified Granulicatella TaxID=2630493 RepID=UPI0013C1810A|nr:MULTISPECIES: primosomal protein DnaI [unclassified Granulicatella]MBS4750619.1 primosomal protein DnaI [Carnobacteriaceae bacterium zg-ZUI78]NEW62868.1 primosomal protein DnaI [Granulicatella sp. zg-ZJ]NEW66313.1 primosomal protein DnaI [Granulicatella sp. zg-84]QMI85379.1 primosomal protein DnaI [Carnobacteriaceae bacterium zg-84]